MADTWNYAPDEYVIGTRICPDEVCQASNQWLEGQRPPDRCHRCERALSCANPTCGALLLEGDDDQCSECAKPRVARVVGVETEFGISLVEARR